MGLCNGRDRRLADEHQRHMSTQPTLPAHRTMSKIRSRSDASLEGLICEPNVRAAFIKFLRREFSEILLEFWLACDDYAAKEHADKKLAQRIFDRYLRDRKTLKLDSATVEQIENIIKASKKNVSPKVFSLASEKIFQRLKFNQFPRFLLSKEFTKLEKKLHGEEFLSGSSTSSAGSMKSIPSPFETKNYLQTIELRHVLNRPTGRATFLDYLTTNFEFYEHMIILEYWVEIDDYRRTNNTEYRRRRAKIISSRFLEDQAPSKVTKLKTSLREKVLANIHEVDKTEDKKFLRDIFLKTQDECLRLLEKPFETFKETSAYNKFLESADVEDGMHAALYNLEAFKEDRQLKETQGKQKQLLELNNFDDMLNSAQALSFFRRFLRLEFSEESLLFYKEVNEYKDGNFLSPKFGTMIFKTDDMTMDDVQKKRAEKLVNKYIRVNSRFQVNIESKERQKIIEKVDGGTEIDLSIFDEALRSVVTFLKLDKFERFKKHKLFRIYQQCTMKRFSMRNFKVD